MLRNVLSKTALREFCVVLWIIYLPLLCSVVGGAVLSSGPQSGRPGLNSASKLWWAKELAPDVYTSGRPSTRWIKYAYEGGLKSILSTFQYNEGKSFGGEYLPTTVEGSNLATSLGLRYVSLIDKDADWENEETIRRFGEAVSSLPRPVLLHCNSGYTVTFLTLMYIANQTRHDPRFEPRVNSARVYEVAAAMGMDYTPQSLGGLVSAVTGEPVVANPPAPNTVPLASWRRYWPAHPVDKQWFTAGQIRRGDADEIKKAGFKSIINLRLGTVKKGRRSQEQVNLLNIKDNTSTYGSRNRPDKQRTAVLERSRINPNLSPDYISIDSQLNYERLNPEEFGDEIGYNEDLERQLFSNRNITYYHLPIDFNGRYKPRTFARIRSALLEAGNRGSVLIHDSTGERAAYIGVLAAAVQGGHIVEWASRRLHQLGFPASPDERPDVYKMYRRTLKQPKLRREL